MLLPLLAVFLLPGKVASVEFIAADSEWKLFRGKTSPTRPDYWAWLEPDYNDYKWEVARSPIFFGEKFESGTELEDMRNRYISFFLRRKFDSGNPEYVQSMTFKTLCDDGFVAWINGVEVARVNVTIEKPKYNTTASKSAREPLRFIEYDLPDPSEFLKEGENTIAIIVLNQSRSSSDAAFNTSLNAVVRESIPPEVKSVSPEPGLVDRLDEFQVTFDEPVIGVDAADLLINGIPCLEVTGRGAGYLFHLDQPAFGKVLVSWDKNHGITDQAETPNRFFERRPSAHWSYELADSNPPFVIRTSPPAGLTVAKIDKVELRFSVPVHGVNADDLLVNGKPAAGVEGTDAGPYTFQLPDLGEGEVTIAWKPDHGITGTNPFKKAFITQGWFYRVDANAPPPPTVVISEIMYHPVEEPVFKKDWSPAINLMEDVHEFIELHNTSAEPIPLKGWKIAGGVEFAFPDNAVIEPGTFRVVAKNPERLASIRDYRLKKGNILGPFMGELSNRGERIRLLDASNQVVETVRYSAAFPWPIGADALGASERWTGLDPMDFQYRGLSLERINFTLPGDDPANWVTSPLESNPSPGRSNSVARRQSMPLPVVTRLKAVNAEGDRIIRKTDKVHMEVGFSSTESLSKVTLEWFMDNIDKKNEKVSRVKMEKEGGVFTTELRARPDRTIVRYRVLADLGSGSRVVSPRQNDPFKWHSYFVTPRASASRPVFELLIPRASLSQLAKNLQANPRSGYRPAKDIKPKGPWNQTAPAVLVYEGRVIDVGARYNGSFFRRNSGRNSYKVRFPRYAQLDNQRGVLFMDKDETTVSSLTLFREIGLPTANSQWVDFYVNKRKYRRLMVDEYDDRLLTRFHEAQAQFTQGQQPEVNGHIFKSSGILQNLGPYGRGDGSKLSTSDGWKPIQRYQWIYSSKNQKWKGHKELEDMINGLAKNKSNRVRLKKWFQENWDIDATLTYIAIRNWMGTWDDTVHNYYLWRRSNGKWAMLPWDFDNDMRTEYATKSIYIGEAGNVNTTHGTHVIKDAVFKALRNEYKEKLYYLNNTHLHPDNIKAMGLTQFVGFAKARQASVNKQCGSVKVPRQPSATMAHAGNSVFPPSLLATAEFVSGETGASAATHASTIWEIRNANDTFGQPVLRVESDADLDSLPIPFDRLEFGRTYYWRATHRDSDGRLSLPTLVASFRYGGHSRSADLIPIQGSQWRYNQDGENLETAWRKEDYDDSNWPVGPGLLGKSTSKQIPKITTQLSKRPRTNYFRTEFEFDGNPEGAELLLTYYVDDGAVFYLNGREIHRFNIKRGRVTFNTKPEKRISTAAFEGPVSISPKYLKHGKNLLAVELHQWLSSDVDRVLGVGLSSTIEALPYGVILNEVMATNQGAVQNDSFTPDWIEFYNPTDEPSDLTGAALSDGIEATPSWFFPPGTTVPAKGFLVVWGDSEKEAPGLHTGFSLDGEGQGIALHMNGENGLYIQDAIQFGIQVPDLSIGRFPSGIGTWVLNTPTLGEPNQKRDTGSRKGLRINEWMAMPTNGSDWFELYNSSSLPVALDNLSVSDDLSIPKKKTLPPLSYIDGKGFLKLVADNNLEMGPHHTGFRLRGSGESIGLFETTGKPWDMVTFGPQEVGVSEGRLPDGRESIMSFPNSATPNRSNQQVATDSDQDGLPDNWETTHGLDIGNALDAAADPDGDGLSNLSEYQVGTDPRNAASLLRLEAERNGRMVVLRFQAAAGKSYQLRKTTALPVRNAEWQKVEEFGPGESERVIEFRHSADDEDKVLFFRLLVP